MDSQLLQGFYLKDAWVEPLKGEIRIRGQLAHLSPKAMEVLLCLASQPCKLVTREAILERVWGPGQGSPEALGRAVSDIRHALEDHADDPAYIQTLPRRGYRLIVEPQASGTEAGPPGAAGLDDAGLFDNLKRRGVIQAGIAYVVVGWLIIQVVDILFDQLHLPAWAGTFVTVLVIAGFPIALLLSWFLEFRDGRAVLDRLSPRDERRRQFSRTYLSVIGALAIAAVAVFLYDSNVGLPVPKEAEPKPAEASAAVTLPPVKENSIAVLPFLNLDGSEQTQIFSSGLVDDVITQLSRVPGLLVSSRGDAFSLDPNSPSARVRARLRVARYVEGSVQMTGDRMRIIVQLIDSASGFHILSRSFDRGIEDFFDVRDEITRLTVANLRVALPAETRNSIESLTDDPNLDVYVLYRRGVEASRLPRKAETLRTALDWFSAALELDPDYAAAHAGRCAAMVEFYEVSDDPGHIADAEAACARALQLNPNLDVVHNALGELYVATGKYDGAEAAFLAALEVDSNNVASLIGLGDVYTLQRKPELAEERLRQATGLHPGDWSAYNALGYFLYSSGRFEEAAQQYEYVVGLDRSNVMGWTNLGAAYMMAGSLESAVSTYQRALEIEPWQTAYNNLGVMYYYLGEGDRAIEAQQRAVELAPNHYLAWSNLGDALWLGGQSEAAHQAFTTAEELARKSLDVNPSDPGVLMDLAWIMAMLEQPEEARGLIDRALTAAPDNPYAHYYSGLIHLRVGESGAAMDNFEAAVEGGYPVALLARDPQLRPIRETRRFRDIVRSGESP